MIPHPTAGYGFLSGIDAYSSGVAALEGHELVHATLETPLPWRKAFEAIAAFLDERGRPLQSLCGIELRSPAPMSFPEFSHFNGGYHELVGTLGLLVDGHNPIARTNVAPQYGPPAIVVTHGFTFSDTAQGDTRHTFVTAGAGELIEDELNRRAVVRAGERSPEAMAEKARHVLSTMRSRIEGLGAAWRDATTINVYTTTDPAHVTKVAIVPNVGPAVARGVHWYPSAPPVDTLDYEMDVRGVRSELVVDLS